MSHVYCPECGFQNPEAANYCARCGAFLRHEDAAETTLSLGPDEVAEAADIVDHGGSSAQHVRRVVVDRVVLHRAVVDHVVVLLP